MSSLQELAPGFDNSQQLINDANSGSRVAEWRLWLFLFSFGTWVLENIMDIFADEVAENVDKSKSHNQRWYQNQALRFQYGDALEWIQNSERYAYPVIDTDKQIITKAAVDDSDGVVIIKVAKSSSPLDAGEYAAFSAYIKKIKDAGTETLIISVPADVFKIELDVYYDPLVLNSDGALISDTSVKPVEVAIDQFTEAIPFDGLFTNTTLVDFMQKATGVIDPVLNSTAARRHDGTFSPVPVNYRAYSGHFAFDINESTINYIANV